MTRPKLPPSTDRVFPPAAGLAGDVSPPAQRESEVCTECGEAFGLVASDGARLCTCCAAPDEVVAFLEGEP